MREEEDEEESTQEEGGVNHLHYDFSYEVYMLRNVVTITSFVTPMLCVGVLRAAMVGRCVIEGTAP